MTVDELGDHLQAHWPEIASRLLACGPWRISISPALGIALPNAFFDRLSLASVAAGHAA